MFHQYDTSPDARERAGERTPALKITPGVVPPIADLPGWFATERDANQVVLSDGTAMVLLMTQAVIVIAIATDLAGADKLATQLQGARCARPGETPTSWPDPAEVP